MYAIYRFIAIPSVSHAKTSSGQRSSTEAVRLGVTRTYRTCHGPGPFPTGDPALDISGPRNGNGRWQGPFRVGHLDAVVLSYVVEVTGGVDAVALTHLDTAACHRSTLEVCFGYDIDGGRQARIKPGPPRDLTYQEELTRTLTKAVPVYDDAPARKPAGGTGSLTSSAPRWR